MLASVLNEGVVLSTDSGMHWKYINDGLTNLEVWSVAIKGNNIYAGANGLAFRRTLAEATGEIAVQPPKNKLLSDQLLNVKVYPNPFTNNINWEFATVNLAEH